MEPLYESKSDVEIASQLARRRGLGDYFDLGKEGFIDLLLNSGNPSVEGITVERLKQGPMAVHEPKEVPGQRQVKFSNPSGKIEIYVERLHEEGQALPEFLDPLEAPVKAGKKEYHLTFLRAHHTH